MLDDPSTYNPKIEKLIAEIAEDLKLDDLSIKQKSLVLISRKHYYVACLIRSKQDLIKVENKRQEVLDGAIGTLKAESVVSAISEAQLMKKAANSETIRGLDNKIKEIKLVIELLEHTVKNFTESVYMTKSIVSLIQMEES